MNPIVGWALALAALLAGWQGYGWQGVLFAFTLIVFWLVLQFNRVLRVMKNAASAPVGHVKSALMLNAKLQPRMTMLDVVALTRSLGRRLHAEPEPEPGTETWAWSDAGGATVTLVFKGGKLDSWALSREAQPEPSATLLESAD
jgi:hypothetical protein